MLFENIPLGIKKKEKIIVILFNFVNHESDSLLESNKSRLKINFDL